MRSRALRRYTQGSVLVLQGGIGNQLFQVNACLKLNQKNLLVVQTNQGLRKSDWLSNLLAPEIDFRYAKCLESWIGRLAGRFILHLNFHPRKFERNDIVRHFLTLILELLISILYREKLTIITDRKKEILSLDGHNFISGYFHNQKLSDKITTSIHFFDGEGSEDFQKNLELIQRDKPVLVHIRRGDYLVNSQFSTLDSSYYQRAIQQLGDQIEISNVWVFSDTISDARAIFPERSIYKTRYLTSVGVSDFELLELMRHAKAFVIANSTFSLWSALTAYDSKAPVIMPNNWFSEDNYVKDTRLEFQTPMNWMKL